MALFQTKQKEENFLSFLFLHTNNKNINPNVHGNSFARNSKFIRALESIQILCFLTWTKIIVLI